MLMKIFARPIILFLIIFSWSLQEYCCPAQDEGPGIKLSALESGILSEMNLARKDPEKYSSFIKDLRNKYRGNFIQFQRMRIKTQEGISAVDEAIEFLDSQKSVPALKLSKGLSLGAADLVRMQGPTGRTGHEGPDGSDPGDRVNTHGKWKGMMGENIYYGHGMNARQIVMGFIIDDGVPDRGHRNTIFNPQFRLAGVACGRHKTFKTMCVITFATGFQEK